MHDLSSSMRMTSVASSQTCCLSPRLDSDKSFGRTASIADPYVEMSTKLTSNAASARSTAPTSLGFKAAPLPLSDSMGLSLSDGWPATLHSQPSTTFTMDGYVSTADRAGKEHSDMIDKRIEEDCKHFKRECQILLLGASFFTGPTMFVIDWVAKVQASRGGGQS